jgi:hypothetical protein
MKHTEEPWDENIMYSLRVSGGGKTVADFRYKNGRNDMLRANACVNACKGINNKALQAGIIGEIVEGLKRLASCVAFDMPKWTDPETKARIQFARDILAKLEASDND